MGKTFEIIIGEMEVDQLKGFVLSCVLVSGLIPFRSHTIVLKTL